MVMGSPLGLTRRPSLMTQPASCSNCVALRSKVRSWPEPSETGGDHGSPLSSSSACGLSLSRMLLDQRDFVRAGGAFRLEVGILEERMCPLIDAEHQVLVGPFEIEGIGQRLAHPAISELRAAQIEEPALRAGRRLVRISVFFTRPSLSAGKS